MLKRIPIICLCLFLYGCVKDKPNQPAPQQLQLSNTKKVFVINEGLFNTGNASISLFDPANDEVISDFFEAQNGTSLGDVAQSMNFINGNYYIVVNNSNKIVVCNSQFKKIAQINGLTSPRHILAITNQKAYVSDLYANAISVINLNSHLKTDSIYCFGKTEQMVLIYNKVIVTNYDKDYAYIINTVSDRIVDSVLVGKQASSICIDKNDKVWVLSATKLSKINPITYDIELHINFSSSDLPYSLCSNKTKDTLYYINSSIYRLPISETNLPAFPFISSNGKNFYGIAVNPNDYHLYASDALDYISSSTIYVYDQKGNQKKVFKAGINANSFYFE